LAPQIVPKYIILLSVRGIFVQVAWRFLLENPGFSG